MTRIVLDWHRIFLSFGACAWLYAPVLPEVLHDETNRDDGWDTALKSIKQSKMTATLKHQDD